MHCRRSLSARRAWIEIPHIIYTNHYCRVALRKESVDRNKYVVQCRKVLGVALRKESVDRNVAVAFAVANLGASLSARRAWIEMATSTMGATVVCVALRKESVDRN